MNIQLNSYYLYMNRLQFNSQSKISKHLSTVLTPQQCPTPSHPLSMKVDVLFLKKSSGI